MSGEVSRHMIQVPEKVLKGIMAIRDSGQTNMMDRSQVMVVGDSLGFFETVCWIEENPKDYRRGIMKGFKVT